MRVFYSVVLSILILPTLGQAEWKKTDEAAIRNLVRDGERSKTPAEFLEKLKDHLPAPGYLLLKEKLKSVGPTLPMIVSHGGGEFILKIRDIEVPFAILDGKKMIIRLNNKTLNLGEIQDPQKQWDTVISALGKIGSTASRWDWVIPKAIAEASPLRMAAGAGVFGGAAILGTMGMTNPLGWITLAGAYVVLDLGVCEDVRNERIACLLLEKDFKRFISNFPDRKQALEQKKSRPACPTDLNHPVVDANQTNDRVKTLSSLVFAQSELTRKIIFCMHGTQKSLKDCTQRTALLAHYLCIDTFETTRAYLPADLPADAAP